MNPLVHNTQVIRQDLAQRHLERAEARRSAPAKRSRKTRASVRAGAAVLGVLIGFAAADQARSASTVLVNENQGVTANNTSYEPSSSAKGRFVAFTSLATNLSQDDHDAVYDVFVRDMREPTIALASRAVGEDGEGGQADSYEPSISASGRYVAFTSFENEFTDEDEQFEDVFVRDFKTNITTLVSRATGVQGDGGNAASFHPSISANGRFVAFESVATNLDEDAEFTNNIYVRDLKANETVLVSRRSGRKGKAGDSSSVFPSISADGTRVAFQSYSDNFSPAVDKDYANVFVRDIAEARTELVSRASGNGAGGDADSFAPDISANGKTVAFGAYAANLDSAGGNATIDVFVRNLESGRTTLASRKSGANGAAGKDSSFSPTISGGGRYVAFESPSANLSKDDDASFVNDIFVRDLKRNRTTLASREGGAGVGGDGHSGAASFAADGRSLVFESEASNLSELDLDGVPDVFRRLLRGPVG